MLRVGDFETRYILQGSMNTDTIIKPRYNTCSIEALIAFPSPPIFPDMASHRPTCLSVVEFRTLADLDAGYENLCNKLIDVAAQSNQIAECVRFQPVASVFWLATQETSLSGIKPVRCLIDDVLRKNSTDTICSSVGKLHRWYSFGHE